MITIILVTLYVLTGIMNYAGIFAYCQRRYALIAKESYRSDMAFSMLVSMIPFIGFFVGFFVTGFYQYGFKFK